MGPGVAFPLLAGVELLAVAAFLALAGVACFPRLRCAGSPLLVVGALVLAVPEAWTATHLGSAGLEWLPLVRTGGALLVAGGVLAGGLNRLPPYGPDDPDDPAGPAGGPTIARVAGLAGTAGVVAPLGAPLAPGALAVAAAVGVGLAALRGPRSARSWLFAAAFLAAAAANGAALAATGSANAASGELALRAVAAVLLLAGVALLCRFSVLTKVVAAIVAGVVVMAVAAVSVVGTVLTSSYTDQQRSQASGVAAGRLDNIAGLTLNAEQLANVVALCPQAADACNRLLAIVSGQEKNFAAVVRPNGDVQQYGNTPALDQAGALQLLSQPAVREVLAGRADPPEPVGTLVSLAGATPTLAAIGIAPGPRQGAIGTPPQYAAVFGYLLGPDYAQASRRTAGSGFDVSLLVGEQVVASSLPPAAVRTVQTVARDTDLAGRPVNPRGLTVPAQGARPTVQFRPLTASNGDQIGLIAVSRSAADVLDTERTALSDVFLSALGVTVLVGLLALLLGRGVVKPVRQLTAAAGRIRAGDLASGVRATSDDEIGTLSRAFDAMTSALGAMTGELRTAAAEQSSLRARLESVLDSMSDGLLTADAAGTVTSVNRAALALLGQPDASALRDRPLASVVDLRGSGDLRVDLPVRYGEVAGELAAADGGRPIPVRASVGPLKDGSGVVVVLRDTHREREVERMKTEFLSNVSHELRTPLTPIRGYADILRRRPDLPVATTSAYAETILDSSVRMGRVVDLLVDVAALEAGRIVAIPQPVAVPPFIQQRLALWRARSPGRADDLRRRAAAQLPAMLIDPLWVGKAYDELIDNALKYSPAGTPVTLTAALSDDGARVRLGVRDAGVGVAADELPGLFAPFEQADASTTRAVGGLGLGLSFVRRLCDDFGLRLRVDSTPGKGSEFVLEVPVTVDAPTPPVPRRRGARTKVGGHRP